MAIWVGCGLKIIFQRTFLRRGTNLKNVLKNKIVELPENEEAQLKKHNDTKGNVETWDPELMGLHS